jgi:hypothetical protein
MAKASCSVCGTTEKELRPYGKDGADICYPCGMAPENIQETSRQFDRVMAKAEQEAGENGVVEIGPGHPPRPMKYAGQA